jgi:single-strand DNA-binding protein
MAGLNSCNFIGRVGKSPEIRSTQGGKDVCTFSLAVDDGWGDNKKVTWLSLVTWDKLAKFCSDYLTKGSLIFVSGKLQIREWDDKEGVKRYSTEIVASNIQMLEKKQVEPQSGSGYGSGQVPDPDGDVPF